MKLSEAIREGAKLMPHYQGDSFYGRDSEGRMRSCTLAAAIDGMRTVDPGAYLIGVYKTVPGLTELGSEIIRRNRTETREQIADWVEQQGY